jgi:hypothetical protein
VQQRIARLTQQGDSPWLLGMIAAMLSFLPMIVIALLAIGFNLAHRGLPWSVLFAPESMLVVPACHVRHRLCSWSSATGESAARYHIVTCPNRAPVRAAIVRSAQ